MTVSPGCAAGSSTLNYLEFIGSVQNNRHLDAVASQRQVRAGAHQCGNNWLELGLVSEISAAPSLR